MDMCDYALKRYDICGEPYRTITTGLLIDPVEKTYNSK